MKKLLSMLLLTVLAVTLSACASSTQKHSYRSVKCPACGYEFTTPEK